MYKPFLIGILALLSFCEDQHNDNSIDPNKCGDNVICTEEFRTITLKVTDQYGNPIELDEHYSFNKHNGKIYTYNDPYSFLGSYTILSDAEMDDVQRSGTKIIFHGIYNGQKILQEFIIGHNCCHIEKISGDDTLIFTVGL